MSKGELALCVWSQTKNINKEKEKNSSLKMTFDVNIGTNGWQEYGNDL